MASTDNLKGLTECSICYSTLLEPKLIPCGHVFCLNCLKRLYQTGGSNVFECPECRAIHEIPHTMIPTDFKLKQLVEMMHKMCNDQASGGEWRTKMCSQCGECGDIKNYFICETCADDDLMQVYCSRCTVKQHQPHVVKEVLDEAKINLTCAIDNNISLIEKIKHNAEFYHCRYTVQNNQLAFVFKMFAAFCEKTKESIKDGLKLEHVQMSDALGRFLEKAHNDINSVYNDCDNRIYQLCMNILATFQEAFNVPQNAMEQLKAKIMKDENVDLFEFFFNLPKDELPNIDVAGPSLNLQSMPVAMPDELPNNVINFPPGPSINNINVFATPSSSQTASRSNNISLGRNKLKQKKKR